MVAIGFVALQDDGSYVGELKTLTISSPMKIVPNRAKTSERQPDYRVYAAQDVEIGIARLKVGESSRTEYLSLTLSIPEFGPKRLTANLGRVVGREDENLFAIIWNPEA